MATKEAVKEKSRVEIKEPGSYFVIMLNDDFTTMDFVVSILIDIFKKDSVSAEQIMMFVHKNGRAVVGEYPYDIAVTKTTAALERAKAQGFPFRMIVEAAH